MCDNFKGWGNFVENALGIISNVCLPHAIGNVQWFCAVGSMRQVTFNCFVLLHATGNVQLCSVSCIAAANRSHVKQFPDVAAYDDYYDIVVDTGEIGVDHFATRVQRLFVEYLRVRYGDDTANWCERFWTGDSGRYCLVHTRYEGCKNNMGVEVTWRDIKKSCDSLGTLGAFIGTLCRCIATAMGEENKKRLKDDSGVPTAFIRAPRPKGDPFKGFALGGDAASGRRAGTISR
jgi:hypothetical protein